jgi:hypothetical protein
MKAIGLARGKEMLRGDPITLTRVAARHDLSHFVGEVIHVLPLDRTGRFVR